MRFLAALRRAYRRAVIRGDDSIYDHELAALRALYEALSMEDRRKFALQVARYDRIDRAPNLRRQQFIDDDSDFWRSNWPNEILFRDAGGTEHSANIVIRRSGSVSVKVEAFIVRGWFSGFEFKFRTRDALSLVQYQIKDVLPRFWDIQLDWLTEDVVLFTPFSLRKSDHLFVGA